MGAVKKSTKKFIKNKLKGVIASRRKHQANVRKGSKGKNFHKDENVRVLGTNGHGGDGDNDAEVASESEASDNEDQNNFGFSKDELIEALKKSKTGKKSVNKDIADPLDSDIDEDDAEYTASGRRKNTDITGFSDESDSEHSDDSGENDEDDDGFDIGHGSDAEMDIEDMDDFESDDDATFGSDAGDDYQSDATVEGEARPAKSLPSASKKGSKVDLQQQLNKEIGTHKEELDELKERDPEFYEYLQKNDKNLLNFKDEDEIEESGNATEDEDAKMDEDDEENEEDEEEMDIPYVEELDTLTHDMVKEWKERILATNSINSLRKMLVAYKSASIMGDNTEEEEIAMAYKIEDERVMKRIVISTLKLTPVTLDAYLGRTNDGLRKVNLPSTYKKWHKISPMAKSLLSSTLRILKTMTDVETIKTVLQCSSIEGISSYFACFPKLGKEYLKLLVRFWTRPEEEIRIVSFLSLRRLASSAPNPYLEMALKACTNAFADQARTTNSQNMISMNFMQDSIVELCAINADTAYQYAFVSVRQLAITLRTAISKRGVETLRKVYNWPYIQMLRLWAKVLGVYCNPDKHTLASTGKVLQALIYPLTQVTIGVLRLKPSSKFIPIKFHCIRILTDLSKSTKVFIPAASYLLEIFDSSDLKSKGKAATVKPIEFKYIIKVPNNYIGTRVLNEGTILETIKLLGEYFAIHENSAAYPELCFPCIIQIRKFAKQQQQMKNLVGNKNAMALVEKLQNKSKVIERQRIAQPY